VNKLDTRLAELAAFGRTSAPHGQTLGKTALELTQKDPNRVILSDGTRNLTRHDMLDSALRLGGALRARGLARRAVIAFQLPNWWEACVIYLAASLFGYRIVPLLTIYRQAELQEMMSACEVEAVFIPRTHNNTNYPALIASLAIPPRLVFTVRDGGADSFEQLISSAPATPDIAKSDDAKLIIFTSGSTGHPKGVIHTHDTMDALIRQTAEFWGTGEGDKLYVASPISHVGGAIYAFEFPWVTGCQVVLEERWDPAQAVTRIDAEGVTFMAGATPFLSGLIEAANNAGSTLPSLRQFVCGGASVSPELVRQGLESFPTAIISRAYGSSEVALVCPGTRTRTEAEANTETDGENIVDVRILDTDGKDVQKGDEGEIAVRAPQMFLGYLNPKDEVGCFTKDGYFLMGDLGRLIEGRFIVITGRTKDIIIRKGENISPVEIENALIRHDAVMQCCVVGRPDEERGEMAVAFAVLKNAATFDFAAMTQHLTGLGLARQKFPECLYIIDKLPVNSVGKVQKPKLRELARELGRANQHQAGCSTNTFLPTKNGRTKAKGD
jgi:acyl-CoA synthetase (AMP-forming)/AMP-acid ligase II